LLLALIGYRLSGSFRNRRRRNRLASAETAGIEFDGSGNVHASATYATLSDIEQYSGERFSGKQAEFMEITRLIANGPATANEIRFLMQKGFEPVVRPDGLVYVPSAENDQLFMDGEIPLVEEDLSVLDE
jgi:hypothetical protein